MNDSDWQHLEDTFQKARASIAEGLGNMSQSIKQARMEYRNLLAELEIELAKRKAFIEEEVQAAIQQAAQKVEAAQHLAEEAEREAFARREVAETQIQALTSVLQIEYIPKK